MNDELEERLIALLDEMQHETEDLQETLYWVREVVQEWARGRRVMEIEMARN